MARLQAASERAKSKALSLVTQQAKDLGLHELYADSLDASAAAMENGGTSGNSGNSGVIGSALTAAVNQVQQHLHTI